MLPLPELLLTLSPETLRAVLSAFGPVPGLPARATPLAIARHLFTASLASLASLSSSSRSGGSSSSRPPRLPPKMATFLWTTLSRFGTRSGRLALVEVARAIGDRRADEWLAMPAADVAARLALEAETGRGRARRAARRFFALADQRLDRDLPERPTYELIAESRESPLQRDPKRILARLRRAFGEDLVYAWDAPEPDGTLRLALFLRQPAEIRLVFDAASSDSTALRSDVPMAVDQVRILPVPAVSAATATSGDDASANASTGRVAITTAMVERLPVYAEALGLSLRPSLTLRPMDKLTAAALRAIKASRISRGDVVGLRRRGPGNHRIELRGIEVLDASHDVSGIGYFDRATFRFSIDGIYNVDAFLQLPHRLDISHRQFEAPIREFFEALGFFKPGALLDDAWSLAPYEHGEWRWYAVLGSECFERMRVEGRFVLVASAHVVTEQFRMHGAAYVVREVPGEPDLQYALAEDRSLGARLVSPKDRLAWRLDVGLLAESMRRDIGSVPPDAAGTIGGLLDLGVVLLSSGRVRIFYVMSEPGPGWADAVRRVCGVGVTPVLFVPRGRAGMTKGILEIELEIQEQLGARRLGRALGRAADALGVPHDVEMWRRCDEEVVVELATRTIWVLGVRITLAERAYSLVAHLAPTGTRVIPTKEVGAHLSSAGSPDVTARKAKAEVEKQVREALAAAGVDPSIAERMIVSEGRKGYRFGVGVRVI
jgi:hypothetical protein